MQRRILIVANSETIGNLLQAALSDEGHDVCTLHDTQANAVQVQLWRPNVILINPGRTRLHEPEGVHRYQTMAPVIVCSVDQEIVAAAAHWPIDGVLSMPFDLTDLYALVDRVAKRPARLWSTRVGEPLTAAT